MLNSYPSIYNLGHAAIRDLFADEVIIEEKIDGSQISFGKTADGELRMRSKGCMIHTTAPEGMFAKAVESVKAIADKLPPGWTFRGEYLNRPRHNVLAYDRVPKNHIIIFDVDTADQCYLSPEKKLEWAKELGFECVPMLFCGKVESPEKLRAFLETESVLGGQKIEGVVIKPKHYDVYGRDKKVLLGKFVSEAFKEIHTGVWNAEHKTPEQGLILDMICNAVRTPARWNKAIQHLREAGKLEDAPKDIGAIMAEVSLDIEKECIDEIKDRLWKWAWPQLRRMVTKGVPEHYKELLMKKQFEVPANARN